MTAPGPITNGEISPGMSFLEGATGLTWLVLEVSSGEGDRVEVTYLVTGHELLPSTRRVTGWRRAAAWRREALLVTGTGP